MTYQTAQEFSDNKIAAEIKDRAAEVAAGDATDLQIAERETALATTTGVSLVPVDQNPITVTSAAVPTNQPIQPHTELIAAIKLALTGHGLPQLEILISPFDTK